MTDFMDILRGRRSIRKYKPDPVPENALAAVLEAVRWSQSWANTQCWELIVITDKAIRARLQEAVPKGNPSYKAIVEAPVLLALCAELKRAGFYKGNAASKFGDWFMFDLGVVTQNIALAAHAHGLGTVVAGLINHDACKEVLGVPEGYELVSLMPLGYPGEQPPAPPRREITAFTHYDTF